MDLIAWCSSIWYLEGLIYMIRNVQMRRAMSWFGDGDLMTKIGVSRYRCGLGVEDYVFPIILERLLTWRICAPVCAVRNDASYVGGHGREVRHSGAVDQIEIPDQCQNQCKG